MNTSPTDGSEESGVCDSQTQVLANLLPGSRSTFSCVSFPSVFASQEGMWDTQISALLGSPTVSGRFSDTGRLSPHQRHRYRYILSICYRRSSSAGACSCFPCQLPARCDSITESRTVYL